MAEFDDARNESNQELTDALDRLNRRLEQLGTTVSNTAKIVGATAGAVPNVLRAGFAWDRYRGGSNLSRAGAYAGGAAGGLIGRRFVGSAAGRFAGGMAGRSVGAAFGSIGGPLGMFGGAVLGSAIGARAFSRRTGVEKQLESQTAILADLLRETRSTGTTIKTAVTVRAAAADPFGRSVASMRGRINSLGLTPSAAAVGSAANVTASRQMADMARQQYLGERATLAAPLRELRAMARFGFNRMGTAGIQGARRHLEAMGSLPFGLGQLTPLGQAGRQRNFGRGIMATLRAGLTGAGLGEQAGPLGSSLARQMFQLETRGPGTILGAPQTARAGTASEYALRVRLQRQALQLDITRRWQDEMLTLTRKMVEQLGLDSDVLYQREIQFGREPSGL